MYQKVEGTSRRLAHEGNSNLNKIPACYSGTYATDYYLIQEKPDIALIKN